MTEETAPFLLLKLRSVDDFDTWLEPTGKVPLRVDMRLAYEPDLAATPYLHRMAVSINGYSRIFAVLSVEPVQDGKDVLTFYPEPGKPPVQPTVDSIAHSWVGEFKASPELTRDIERLMDFMERRGTTESLAYGAVGRTGN
jgi:hypothetical protein